MTSLVLDTHVLYWLWAGEVGRLSRRAREAVDRADGLLVSAISWYELALLFERGRIDAIGTTPEAAVASMADRVLTAPISWRIALRAAALEASADFPRDPADRLVYATAVDRGARLVTADGRLRSFSGETCLW